MRFRSGLIALVFLAASPLSAYAQPRETWMDRFAAANTTNDGCLTHQQAVAGRMPMIAQLFGQIDTQNKGCVTVAEIRAYQRAGRQQTAATAAPKTDTAPTATHAPAASTLPRPATASPAKTPTPQQVPDASPPTSGGDAPAATAEPPAVANSAQTPAPAQASETGQPATDKSPPDDARKVFTDVIVKIAVALEIPESEAKELIPYVAKASAHDYQYLISCENAGLVSSVKTNHDDKYAEGMRAGASQEELSDLYPEISAIWIEGSYYKVLEPKTAKLLADTFRLAMYIKAMGDSDIKGEKTSFIDQQRAIDKSAEMEFAQRSTMLSLNYAQVYGLSKAGRETSIMPLRAQYSCFKENGIELEKIPVGQSSGGGSSQ